MKHLAVFLLVTLAAIVSVQAAAKPVKVFILAGQSNDKFNAEYETNMTHFIRDMRKELGTPALPFVIAETGMNGPDETHPRTLSLMKAQAAVAQRAEFKGNVAFVATRSFWRAKEQSPSGQNYHWNSNAETYYLIGEGMGEAMKRLSGR